MCSCKCLKDGLKTTVILNAENKDKKQLNKEIRSYLRQISNFLFCLILTTNDSKIIHTLPRPSITDVYKSQNTNFNWITLQSNVGLIFGISFWGLFPCFLIFGADFSLGWCNISLLRSSKIYSIAQRIFHPVGPN
jgi:hypothetical protein